MLKRLEILLLLVGILITGGLTWLNANTQDTKANIAFGHLVEDDVRRLDGRMQKYLQALIATGAYLQGSENVTPAKFSRFVDDLNIEKTLPGINGIGVIEAVNASDLAAFENRIQAEGNPGFTVFPSTEGPQKFVIRRISPMSTNAPALGLDISFEEGRRSAALRARAQGTPQLTATITLVQDDRKEAGFLLLLPVNAEGPDTWVYAPFVARDLLGYFNATRTPSYVMRVFDGPVEDASTEIYTSTQRYETQDLQANPVTGTYSITQGVTHFGRNWTLVFDSTAHFDAGYNARSSAFIFLAGLLLTAMLVSTLRNMRMRNTALQQVATLQDRQIKAQENANRSVIENAVTPVMILNQNDKVLFANQAACDCFGYDEKQMQELRFPDLVTPPRGAAKHATGHTKSGTSLILDLQRNTWSTEAGAERTTAIVRDITVEQNAHRAIIHTKTQYDLALKGSRIGVFDLNLETGESEVSDTWCMIMGHDGTTSKNHMQNVFLSRVHPNDLDVIKAADAACICGETDRSISEYRLKMPDGSWRWMKSDAVVSSRAADGRALHLIGTQIDVTDVYHARNALEASEGQFRQTLAAAPIGTVILDTEGRFVGSNKAFCDLVGVAESVLARSYTMHDFIRPKDIATLYRVMAERAESGTTDAFKTEYPLARSTGPERLGLFHVSSTYNKNLRSTLFILQIIDITEQRRVEKLKDEFVATVSHELRTPLTSIKGALGLLTATEATNDTVSANRLIEIASSNADRLAAIVNDILDLEKISSGDMTFEVSNINLSSIITQAAEVLQPFAMSHGNTFDIALADSAIMIQGDTLRTQQVLENLMSNACKYSHRDTPVRVSARYDGDMAVVMVTNHGDGIPKDFQAFIFDAFSQADGSDTRAKGGTGLGLNISQQIVKRQGGEIGFETSENGDTMFWFSCPLATLASSGPPPKKVRRVRASDGRPLVLHLEDDADFAEVIRAGLAPHADVVHAANMDTAKIMLSDLVLDAIILDWGLPDGDASAILGRMRLLQPSARIIGLTADATRKKDPRVAINIIKTRTDDMPDILDAILNRDAAGAELND